MAGNWGDDEVYMSQGFVINARHNVYIHTTVSQNSPIDNLLYKIFYKTPEYTLSIYFRTTLFKFIRVPTFLLTYLAPFKIHQIFGTD